MKPNIGMTAASTGTGVCVAVVLLTLASES